jgi:hypothetical protein
MKIKVTRDVNETKTTKVFVYVVLFIMSGLFLLILNESHKKSQLIGEESSKNYSREISGIVATVTQNRGVISLRLKTPTERVYYFGITTNYELKPSDFDDFVKGGDSVYKAPNSNEIFVFRDNQRYYFVLEKYINH